MKKLWPLMIALLCLPLLMKQNKEIPVISADRKLKSFQGKVEEHQAPKKDQLEFMMRWKIKDYHQAQSEYFNSPLGKTVVYSFSQDGVPILGMNIRIKERADGVLVEEENTYRPISKVPIQKEVVQGQADRLKDDLARYDFSELSTDSLVILVRDGLKEGELAFSATAIDKLGSGVLTQLVIRTDDGKVLRKAYGRKEY